MMSAEASASATHGLIDRFGLCLAFVTELSQSTSGSELVVIATFAYWYVEMQQPTPVALGFLLFATLIAGACGRTNDGPPAPTGPPVRVDGSSRVNLVSKVMADEAEKQGLAKAAVSESSSMRAVRPGSNSSSTRS